MDPIARWDKGYDETQAISLHSRRWSSGTNGNAFGQQRLQHSSLKWCLTPIISHKQERRSYAANSLCMPIRYSLILS
jgi:hypothetical protein